MNLFNNDDGKDSFYKSRFQVTPRNDIESAIGDIEFGPSTPLATDDHDQSNEPLFEMIEENGNNNTVTTTSSSNSFYNTIYKYRKLKQNDNSLDAVYFPMYKRRISTAPYSVVGISFYNERVLVYNFLQRPTGAFAVGYHVFVSMAVVYCLVLTIISTSSKYGDSITKMLNTIDYLIITFFIVEFLARLWSSECVSYYQGWKGKIRFFKNPIRIIDLCVIVISVIVLISNAHGELLITSLRGVRFIQIFQMVRLDFKFRPWHMMASVVYSQRIHLAIVFYMGFLALIFISFVIYFVEKDHNEDFESLASSMWWAVITLCTIGYGDMYPKTSTGKLLACICSLIGVSIFALPAGILGTGLALKVQEQQRQLKISKRKQPAARLIQCAWKLYIAEQELIRLSNKNRYNLSNKESSNLSCYRSVIWKRFESNKNKSRILTSKEMNSLYFVFAVKFCIAKRDFVKAFKPYDIKDVLEQYAAGHADMLAKIRMMDHRLEKIQANSISAKAQHEIKLRFATHLSKFEYELQKMQIHLNDLMHYQVNSRLIIENLLKYLLDQQSYSAHFSSGNCRFGLCKTGCNICLTTNKRTIKLSSQFHQLDFVTKIDQIFKTYNKDLLAHLSNKSSHLYIRSQYSSQFEVDSNQCLRRRRKSF